MMTAIDDQHEWLEADGRGGFASGTTSGVRTRRYHALLLSATTPPTGRVVLVNGLDAWVDTPAGTFALSTQRYAPGVLHPDGVSRIESFTREPWPTWTFGLPDGTRVRQEILVERATGVTVVTWTLVGGPGPAALRVRPFMSGRDYHATHHENGAFGFDARVAGGVVSVGSYEGLPAVRFLSDGQYEPAPDWYRNFLYEAERERGLDAVEDLASPGVFTWTLPLHQPASLLMAAEPGGTREGMPAERVTDLAAAMREAERERRGTLTTTLDRSADDYLVTRGRGRTIVAGYPWFTDWGRDTFIALRGLCLATGRLRDARDILVEWAAAVSEGMLPNRFADRGEEPEYNSVDASLWYVIAVHELFEQALAKRDVLRLDARDRRALERAVLEIVSGYAAGTRFGIRMDRDGLLASGAPGVQLTWMDARVGDWVVTPRIGKPVEIQALWLNALWVASQLDPAWTEALALGQRSFTDRFWDDARGCLADVVDVDHVAGTRDLSFRPNQILAVGGLPLMLVDRERAARIVEAVEARLVTPIGLRSLAPGEPGYAGRYEGDGARRDAVYHQGTVWPWLMGPFVDAWIRVRGGTEAARLEARRRFVGPLFAHLNAAGLDHVSEIADADPPFTPRGCPFQAWSLGELLRLDRVIAPAVSEAGSGTADLADRRTGVVGMLTA